MPSFPSSADRDSTVAAASAAPVDDAGCHSLVAEIERLRAELAAAHCKIDNLEIALTSSRQIGAALGVLMTRHGITVEAAFELLREASQHTHRKLRDIAADVLYTGTLESVATPNPTAVPH